LKRKKLTSDGDPGAQIFVHKILMRHIQSSQSRAPQEKEIIVATTPTYLLLVLHYQQIFRLFLMVLSKKAEFKHVLYEFSFPIKTNVHKNQYFLEEPPPCPMPFQQVAFNLMLKKVVKPCPTWAVSLLVLFFYMTVRVNFFLKFIF